MSERILSEFLATMPFHLFAYLPFYRHLRVKHWMLALILITEEAASLLLMTLLINSGLNAHAANMIFMPIAVITFFYLVKMERGKIAFMYIFTTAYVLAARGLAGYLANKFFSVSEGTLQFSLTILGVFILSLPFMAHYIMRTANLVFETKAPSMWKTIWLLPLFSVTMVMIFTYANPYKPISVIARLMMMAIMFLTSYFLVYAVSTYQKQLEREEEIRRLEEISTIQSNQYAMLKSRMEETRRARHDLRQHLMAIQGCIDSGDMDALAAYVREYGANLPSDSTRTFCKNFAVDAVLRYYVEKAIEAGVDVDVSFDMADQTIIPEPTLCVLLGNLLENALNACHELDGARFIRVNARQTGTSMLSIAIDNSGKKPVELNGRLMSTKHEGMGTGTESVRLIAQRYGGDAKFHWDDGVFYASVILNP